MFYALFMIGLMCNGGSVDVFFCMVSMVIVLWQVNAILGGKNYVAWFQRSEMPVGFHYRNLILGTKCFR